MEVSATFLMSASVASGMPRSSKVVGRPTSSKKSYSSSSSSAGAPSTMSCTRMPKATTSPCSSLAQGSRTVMPSAME